MSEHGGLKGIWEDFNSYLSVDIEVKQNESSDNKLPVIIQFTVTNNGKTDGN
ncbi:hypothetical protein ACFLTB_02710 [Chloroflexota bacterium]